MDLLFDIITMLWGLFDDSPENLAIDASMPRLVKEEYVDTRFRVVLPTWFKDYLLSGETNLKAYTDSLIFIFDAAPVMTTCNLLSMFAYT